MSYRVDIMTLFPESMEAVLGESIIGRAAKKGILEINAVQIRDYTTNRQKQVDDYPYGGGWGLVMSAQPLKACLDTIMQSAEGKKSRVIYLTPQGKPFTQAEARRLRDEYDHLVLVCGHYEGVDERFIEQCVDEEISLGDFVLTGGEIAAMAVTDSVCRMVPGVLSDEECYTGESHWSGLLEYPQYTRPEVWEGESVPPVLLTGDHAKIVRWRRERALERTFERRADMYARFKAQDAVDEAIMARLENKTEIKRVFEGRRAEERDVASLVIIGEQAKAYLKSQGVDQWQGEYPNADTYRDDISKGQAYVLTENGEAVAYVALIRGDDPCYATIDGAWLTEDAPYTTIHRSMVAESARGSGASVELFGFCEDLSYGMGVGSIRVDTHEKNAPMNGLLIKNGYTYCGMIEVNAAEGHDRARRAYEKKI